MKKFVSVYLILLLFYSASAQNPEKPGLTVGGNVGLGYGILTGNLKEYINNPVMLPITIDFMYKNFLVQLNLDGGYSKVSRTMEFPEELSWNKGDNVWHNYVGGNLGYAVLNNNKILLAPVAGYAYGYFSKYWWNTSDIVHYEPYGNYLNVAVFADIKLNRAAEGSGLPRAYSAVRITVGSYIPMGDVKPLPEYYNGAMVYMSVGYAVFSDFGRKK